MDPQALLSIKVGPVAMKTPRLQNLPSEAEVGACRALPDLRDRIQDLGLTDEYKAFSARYQAWRRGKTQDAQGDAGVLGASGFGYWYPSEDVWSWRRTMSYWIAVCLFQGAVFFTVSSFLFCLPSLHPEALGPYTKSVTTFGYVAGKVHFLIGTYLMCIETINLRFIVPKSHSQSNTAIPAMQSSPNQAVTQVSFPLSDQSTVALPLPCDRLSELESGSPGSSADEVEPRFYYSPFRYRVALANLEHVGSGPWPYYAAVVYFVGASLLGFGLLMEFVPMPEVLEFWLKNIFFTMGSFLFLLGGVAECVENSAFSTLKCNAGWWGAMLNFLGGTCFFVASVLGFFEQNFGSSFVFGIGSALFTLASGIMIVMWKDEQFGLAFLAVLNNLGGPNGRPMVVGSEQKVVEAHTFSKRGAVFVMIFCLAANMSVYNFLTALADVGTGRYPLSLDVERAFDSLLPCIFAHVFLGLNAAFVETPKRQPFHLLYISCRWLALFMIANGTANFVETLLYGRDRHHCS